MDILVVAICLIALLFTAVYAINNKFKYGKGLARVLLGLYVLFIVAAVGV